MIIIVDIDGTIADCRHRRHFINDGNNDWNSFYESMVTDEPIKPITKIIFTLGCIHEIIFCTGRPEKYRNHTNKWIRKYINFYGDDKIIYMRKENDNRPDYIVKEEMLLNLIAMGKKPDLVFEDKQECVDMWRSHGIITLQNSMKEMEP